MALLNRDQVKAVVVTSLEAVADLPADVEAATFNYMTDMQKNVFLTQLKSNLNASPYIQDDGTTSDTAYYDVDLMPDSIYQWPTVKDCIDWVTANQMIVYR